MNEPYQQFSGSTGQKTYPTTSFTKNTNSPLYFGGIDFAKRVHTSALEIFELIDDTKLNDSILIERGHKVWNYVNYRQISIDTHTIYKKFSMYQIGFDRSGVGDAAIELFDITTLPMTPILTTNKFKIDMVNSIETLRQSGRIKFGKNSPVPAQLDGQLEHKNPSTGTLSYPHGSVPNDSLMAAGYAVNVAVPFMTHADNPIIYRQGNDNLYYSPKEDIQMMMDNLLERKSTKSKQNMAKYQHYKNY